ncbi:hypothetical protein GW17_00024154 [Ensete ventricosum]|nr:hypothetical protein GW17_00024154 [Ensete ventricosum]RZS12420.1 hypothetical protein BHM03_00043861 [Ensete ventricosum]
MSFTPCEKDPPKDLDQFGLIGRKCRDYVVYRPRGPLDRKAPALTTKDKENLEFQPLLLEGATPTRNLIRVVK